MGDVANNFTGRAWVSHSRIDVENVTCVKSCEEIASEQDERRAGMGLQERNIEEQGCAQTM